MLRQLMAEHRDELLALARDRISRQRPASPDVDDIRAANLPAFLDAVIAGLPEHEPDASDVEPSPGKTAPTEDDAFQFDIDELVHEYGSLCYSTIEIARRLGKSISLREHQALNQSLDDCIARTVAHWEHDRKQNGEAHEAQRLGFVAHELRNALHTAAISFQAIRSGRIPVHGLTGDVVERSHLRLRAMVESLLTQVRLGAGLRGRQERLVVAQLVHESITFVSADANEKRINLAYNAADAALEVVGDRTLLVSALTNLLQNAVKFTHREGVVTVRTSRDHDGRVLVEVEDECGGLPPGAAENLFAPFVQASQDRSGLGLGLTIAAQVVDAHSGSIDVRDVPGRGCVFAINLPAAEARLEAQPAHT
ncbi:MAG: sensor histidine kinase [Myxococcales bacterium]